MSLMVLGQVCHVEAGTCRRARTHRPITIVRAHFRQDGSYVRSHYRRSHVIATINPTPRPRQSRQTTNLATNHWVRGYRRANGTYVAPHWSMRSSWRTSTRTYAPTTPGVAPVLPSPSASQYSGPAPSTSPSAGMVWVDTKSGIFHEPGSRWYGRTAKGEYMSEAEAVAKGYRPSRSGQ